MQVPPQAQISKGLRWSGRTDRGKVRPNNEDAFLGLQFDGHEVRHLGKIGEGQTGKTDYAFAVSDGMGGAMAGEIASKIAIEKITALLPRAYRQSAAGLVAGITDVLEELFTQIHRSLADMGRAYEECRGMEATLSLVWFTPGKMYFAHVGDSRIYYLPAGTGPIKQLTEDDTHVGWLLRNGHIKEWEARSHPRRNLLQKALGGNNQFVTPQVGAVPYEPGDMFLLCSDGLTEGLYDQDLHDFLRLAELQETNARPAERLVNESLERSGRDNTTALVVRVF
jgi:PPM family protein phosphatase